MSPEAQRIAIAEACGWIKLSRPLTDQDGQIGNMTESCWWHPKIHTAVRGDEYWLPSEPPDYLNDLNAMAEAERWLGEGGFQNEPMWVDSYLSRLTQRYGDHAIVASPGRRAEAFLKTLNLWDDTK